MDAEVALLQIRTLVADYRERQAEAKVKVELEALGMIGAELTDAIADLDHWLAAGGAPPREWSASLRDWFASQSTEETEGER